MNFYETDLEFVTRMEYFTLDGGLTPVMVKETVYQAVDYLGIGRVLPFLTATNEILTARGVALPLPPQATTTMEDRLEKGADAQAQIFGEHMKEAWKAGHINRWLAANCFWRLLHKKRTGLKIARADNLLLFDGTGRLRATAYGARKRQHYTSCNGAQLGNSA